MVKQLHMTSLTPWPTLLYSHNGYKVIKKDTKLEIHSNTIETKTYSLAPNICLEHLKANTNNSTKERKYSSHIKLLSHSCKLLKKKRNLSWIILGKKNVYITLFVQTINIILHTSLLYHTKTHGIDLSIKKRFSSRPLLEFDHYMVLDVFFLPWHGLTNGCYLSLLPSP